MINIDRRLKSLSKDDLRIVDALRNKDACALSNPLMSIFLFRSTTS